MLKFQIISLAQFVSFYGDKAGENITEIHYNYLKDAGLKIEAKREILKYHFKLKF